MPRLHLCFLTIQTQQKVKKFSKNELQYTLYKHVVQKARSACAKKKFCWKTIEIRGKMIKYSMFGSVPKSPTQMGLPDVKMRGQNSHAWTLLISKVNVIKFLTIGFIHGSVFLCS
jgi:hypothetical protein